MACLLRLVAVTLCASFRTSAGGESETVSSSKTQDGTYQDMTLAKEKQLADMIRAREMPETSTSLESPYEVPLPRNRRVLTPEELKHFESEGYVILEHFFSQEEVDIVKNCMENDPLVMGSTADPSAGRNISVPDATGRSTKLTLWWNFGDDSFGQVGRSASMIGVASDLMGGAEPFSSHTKILLKEPRTGGAWEWHQDFGYWYAQGLNQPDKIVSGIVAIDENDRENGAMRVLAKSHKLGRLDHGVYGGQAGADPERVLQAMELPGFDVRTLLLKPGDVAFTHSNLLHCSRPNDSDRWRRNFIVAYNSKGNDPVPVDTPVQPHYAQRGDKAFVVPDDALLTKGCIPLDPARTDFLGQEETEKAVTESETLQDSRKDEV